MTQAQTSGQPAQQTKAQTPQQFHLKAAEHHDQASIYHKEAAKHLDSGDQNAAARSVKLASEHTTQAAEHCKEACKEAPTSRGPAH